MTPDTEMLARNRELAQAINEEALRDPQSPYAGKWVGIANGQIVVVTEDLDELVRHLREVEPDPLNTFIIEASQDYTEVEDIWRLH